MEISEVTVRILLIFFPGIICAMMLDALTVHSERKPWFFALTCFVLGLACYILTFGIWQLAAPSHATIVESLVKVRAEQGAEALGVAEIVVASLLSVPLALGLAYVSNHNVLHRMAQKAGVTKRFGDLDV